MRFFIGLFACLLVCACGVKPGHVSAPDGEHAPPFPQTYPNVHNDPAPISFDTPLSREK